MSDRSMGLARLHRRQVQLLALGVAVLVAALEWLTDDLERQTNIRAEVRVAGVEKSLAPEVQVLAFRIAQAALSNVRRHSEASEANIALEFAQGRIRITIEDNGKGFELPERITDLANLGKLGLLGMQERARLLGGNVSILSAPGHGTTVVAELPA